MNPWRHRSSNRRLLWKPRKPKCRRPRTRGIRGIPERVALAYTEDSDWRNRDEFFQGREAIKAFLRRKWAKELDYRLRKELWCWTENRIAVTFQYEWHDPSGHWFRAYGNELWEFDEQGLMRRRIASINDAPIAEGERKIL